jgi:hypothetical protein
MMPRALIPTIALLCIGIMLLALPTKLQEWAIRAHRNTRGPARRIPDMDFVEGRRYVAYLRSLGAVVLLAGGLLAYATLTNR